MPIQILMPALSPTMEEGALAKWTVKEGDSVSSGDVIAEIETDKATMEVEAVDEGTIGKLLVAEGTEGVKVNAVIALLLEEGEDASALDAASAAPVAAPQMAQSVEITDAAPAPVNAPAAPQTSDGGRVFASPLARRIAVDKGVDLANVTGSGPRGRIVKADVEDAAARPQTAASGMQNAAPELQNAAVQTPNAAAQQPMADDKIRAMFEEGSFEEIPHDNMRKTIARRLTEAKSTIPHFYLSADCRLDTLLKLRADLNGRAAKDKDGKPAYKVSVNDFVIKALAMALQEVPDANVAWTAGAMLKHRHSDVGVAVSIPGGLITPVVRKAETKGLAAISNEMKDFAARARARKLAPHEYQGGSSAVSNLGMFGVKDFSAVINPPHATILAVGAGEQRPVIIDGAVAAATVMTATLSTDHRAVDGALGAQLLGAFKTIIEDPLRLML